MASCARFGRCRAQRNLCATRPEVDKAYRPTRIIVVSVIFPIGSILLFIRQRLGLHHQREKSNRCLGYEGVTGTGLNRVRIEFSFGLMDTSRPGL